MLIQKYVGFFLVLRSFRLCGALAEAPLSYIADHSFGLYFVHAIVIAVLMRMPETLSPHIGEPMIDLAIYYGWSSQSASLSS